MENPVPTKPEHVVQEEMPFAIVQGEPLTILPQDLYIPPDALEVILEAFEGPLDLLLYLIKRQNLDILEIPVAEITRQYTDYISMMGMMRLELAAEYLVMAAMLAEIKSRLLLPRPVEDDDPDDPRADLVRRLQEYERFKKAAEDIDALPRLERDVFDASASPPRLQRRVPLPDVALRELLLAFRDVVNRAELFTHHKVQREALSVRERMSSVLAALKGHEFVGFTDLFDPNEGRAGAIITLLATLELIRESLVDIVQAQAFAPIYLKPRHSTESIDGENSISDNESS